MIEPIEFARLDEELRHALIETSAHLSLLSPINPAKVLDAPEERFSYVKHRLSEAFIALNGETPQHNRSELEAVSLNKIERRFGALHAAGTAGFMRKVARLNHMLGGPGKWRSGIVRLDRDLAGKQVQFPPATAIPPQLERLRLVLQDTTIGPTVFRAAIVYLLLTNCHPFNDGNGRVGRVLLNHVLRQGGMPPGVYLPLYEISNRSKGGYEITLRIAELRGDWEPFLRFIMNAIRCHIDIAVNLEADPAVAYQTCSTSPGCSHA